MKAIDQIHNIEALRALARKRLPRMVFDYIDGGSDDEITLARNDNRYGDYELNFKSLVDISKIELDTTIMGAPSKAPIIVTPTAAQRLFNPRAGEAAEPTRVLRRTPPSVIAHACNPAAQRRPHGAPQRRVPPGLTTAAVPRCYAASGPSPCTQPRPQTTVLKHLK